MVSPAAYVQEVIQELRKVSWPSRQQTLRMTGLVVAVSVLVAFYLGALDVLFQTLMRMLVNR